MLASSYRIIFILFLSMAVWLQRRRTVGRSLCLGLVAALLLWLIPPSLAAAMTPKHYTELTFPPLPEIQVPAYERRQLANGMVVYLLEDHEWPLVRGTLIFRAGSRWDPPAQVGLAEVSGDLIRTGGTQVHRAAEIDQWLEDRAAAIESGVGKSLGRINFNSLKEHSEAVLSQLAEMLQAPAVEPERFELAIRRRQGIIQRRDDQPNAQAEREFYKLIYGAESPYARTQELETLAKITPADVQQFYRRYLAPSRCILGLVGDFDASQMGDRLEAIFGSWQDPPNLPPLPPLPRVTVDTSPTTVVINRPHLSQSYIYTGQLGGTLKDPDVFNLYVLNGVLNGFGGRLFNEVRSRQGLAYSVYAAWSPEFDYPGVFYGVGQTQTQTTAKFLSALRQEIQRLQQEPVSAAELNYAKDSILNSFVFNFRDRLQILNRLLRYEYYDLPKDFIFRYQRAVKAATAADLQRVAQTRLKPEQWRTLIVGDRIPCPTTNCQQRQSQS
ncbi:pitrilysin family protein [Thermosynechococcus sp. PP45]|uniref:M16 family metallopeptidase n=1 Tax=unclassified Thermosynechococcus TaxID=2622553 RepID=UPI002673CC45|nr:MULTISPECIES: pitrilysin family protein [unclassified Thermosynechococcus]MDR5638233.1 pitrilysin family protein [Thermosynechococcus sp. PP42]WKT81559.1 pitrilysin family protein [Thermosynechococcus sp. PP45]